MAEENRSSQNTRRVPPIVPDIGFPTVSVALQGCSTPAPSRRTSRKLSLSMPTFEALTVKMIFFSMTSLVPFFELLLLGTVNAN